RHGMTDLGRGKIPRAPFEADVTGCDNLERAAHRDSGRGNAPVPDARSGAGPDAADESDPVSRGNRDRFVDDGSREARASVTVRHRTGVAASGLENDGSRRCRHVEGTGEIPRRRDTAVTDARSRSRSVTPEQLEVGTGLQ